MDYPAIMFFVHNKYNKIHIFFWSSAFLNKYNFQLLMHTTKICYIYVDVYIIIRN